jgi:hypothetical protein
MPSRATARPTCVRRPKHLLYAQLWPGETVHAVMTALSQVVRTSGLPLALYTDRAGWAFHTRRWAVPSITTRADRSCAPYSSIDPC